MVKDKIITGFKPLIIEQFKLIGLNEEELNKINQLIISKKKKKTDAKIRS